MMDTEHFFPSLTWNLLVWWCNCMLFISSQVDTSCAQSDLCHYHSFVSSNFVDMIMLTSRVYAIAWDLWQPLAWHTRNSFQADHVPFKSNSREPHYEGIAGDHFEPTLAFWCRNTNFWRSHIGFCQVLTYRKVPCATLLKFWINLCPTCLSPTIVELHTNLLITNSNKT